MAVIYMRHPMHGTMVFSTELEANVARGAGWEEFDPALPKVIVPAMFGTTLPDSFPGVQALIAAELFTKESLRGKTADDLKKIKGIVSATALQILDAWSE